MASSLCTKPALSPLFLPSLPSLSLLSLHLTLSIFTSLSLLYTASSRTTTLHPSYKNVDPRYSSLELRRRYCLPLRLGASRSRA